MSISILSRLNSGRAPSSQVFGSRSPQERMRRQKSTNHVFISPNSIIPPPGSVRQRNSLVPESRHRD